MNQIHIIGAGLAGLAAALSLTAEGRSVVVHEAGPTAGGRCRSFFDKGLGLGIDNGNHLLLSGNRAAMAYIAETNAEDRFQPLDQAIFPFMDLKTHARWKVRPNKGSVPWWILHPARRVPGTKLSDYLRMARIARIRDDTPVSDSMRRGRLYWRLLEPLAVAALNTPPQEALARLLGVVMRETLLLGADACVPILPKAGLSAALIDPAVALLQARGAELRFNSRVAGLSIEAGRVSALRGSAEPIKIDRDDRVVLAVPPWIASGLLPGLVAPNAFQAILNIHFRHTAAAQGPLGRMGFVGLTAGTAEWLFTKPDHVSVTISAANHAVDDPAPAIATRVWPDVVDALALPACVKHTLPAFRVVKEKRATFAATAEQETRRPLSRTDLASNLALAGDWTATGLPATIEGAIRSGRAAADIVLSLR